ncbi:hypothetical protein BGS_0650 [Beggiatoa sp. SS]|nr:hypothetical protein BGS_0650 [Beggiatoa sp. SS]
MALPTAHPLDYSLTLSLKGMSYEIGTESLTQVIGQNDTQAIKIY